eukprot:3760743-Ditylum_brightwellii.AAC.1
MPMITVPKPKRRAKTPSIWVEKTKDIDKDQYSFIFEKDIGQTLRKVNVTETSQDQHRYVYNEETDKKELEKNLVIDAHIEKRSRDRIIQFVKEYWDIFRGKGVSEPVKDYELVIDTGEHQLIAVKKKHYGLHETPIMEKIIKDLLNRGHI